MFCKNWCQYLRIACWPFLSPLSRWLSVTSHTPSTLDSEQSCPDVPAQRARELRHTCPNKRQALDGPALLSHSNRVDSSLSAWTHANNGARLERWGPKPRGRADGLRDQGPKLPLTWEKRQIEAGGEQVPPLRDPSSAQIREGGLIYPTQWFQIQLLGSCQRSN